MAERRGANIAKVAAARKLLSHWCTGCYATGISVARPGRRDHKPGAAGTRGRSGSDPHSWWRGRRDLVDPTWPRPYHSMPAPAGGEWMTGNRVPGSRRDRPHRTVEDTADHIVLPGTPIMRHSEPASRPRPLRGSTYGRAPTPTARWRLSAPSREPGQLSRKFPAKRWPSRWVGFLAAFPANRWLIARRGGHAVVHQHHRSNRGGGPIATE